MLKGSLGVFKMNIRQILEHLPMQSNQSTWGKDYKEGDKSGSSLLLHPISGPKTKVTVLGATNTCV